MSRDSIDQEEFIVELLREFPHLREEVDDESGIENLPVQMLAFTACTQEAIDRADTGTARRCLLFADRMFGCADARVSNSLGVSYLGNLDLTGSQREWALALMSSALRQAYSEIWKHMG